jgi:hypothetical protein
MPSPPAVEKSRTGVERNDASKDLSTSIGMRAKVEEYTTFSTFGLLFYPEDEGQNVPPKRP